jgi:hypothetical protein
MIAHTTMQQEEAKFLIYQAEEEERRQNWDHFKEAGEAARQEAWERQSHAEDTQRIADWEERKSKAEAANLAKQQAMEINEKNKDEQAAQVKARAEKDIMKQGQVQTNTSKRAPSY